jgi:hypothetical protein
MEESMIQVEMPKWLKAKDKKNLFTAMDRSNKWYLYIPKPWHTWLSRIFGKWINEHPTSELSDSINYAELVLRVKVTGYTGTWQDSLHHWNGTAWVKEN